MVDNNQFFYQDKLDDIYLNEVIVLSHNYLWNQPNGRYYSSSERSIESTSNDICQNKSGYKGCYYISGDTLYTEIITGDMEHLFRNYLIKGDRFEYISFQKMPRFRNRAIRQKLYPEDIINGTMTREYLDSTVCKQLQNPFW